MNASARRGPWDRLNDWRWGSGWSHYVFVGVVFGAVMAAFGRFSAGVSWRVALLVAAGAGAYFGLAMWFTLRHERRLGGFFFRDRGFREEWFSLSATERRRLTRIAYEGRAAPDPTDRRLVMGFAGQYLRFLKWAFRFWLVGMVIALPSDVWDLIHGRRIASSLFDLSAYFILCPLLYVRFTARYGRAVRMNDQPEAAS